jgi:hypothetical protein
MKTTPFPVRRERDDLRAGESLSTMACPRPGAFSSRPYMTTEL